MQAVCVGFLCFFLPVSSVVCGPKSGLCIGSTSDTHFEFSHIHQLLATQDLFLYALRVVSADREVARRPFSNDIDLRYSIGMYLDRVEHFAPRSYSCSLQVEQAFRNRNEFSTGSSSRRDKI
jgi:hypothetical protein